MVSSAATPQDLSVLLDGLRAQEEALKAEHERRLAELAADRKAVERTMQLLTAASVAAVPPQSSGEHHATDVAPDPTSALRKPMSESGRGATAQQRRIAT